MVQEARLEAVQSGLAPVGPGWFVVNTAEAAWLTNATYGGVCIFESDDFVLRGRPDLQEAGFEQAGFTIRVVPPGHPSTAYHTESEQQEDFLVLMGEGMLLVEGEERPLRTWDFVHCPPGTAHGFIASGDGPFVLLGTGNRADTSKTVYLPDEAAARHGAAVDEATSSGEEVYANAGEWRLERPPDWDKLPWSSADPGGGS